MRHVVINWIRTGSNTRHTVKTGCGELAKISVSPAEWPPRCACRRVGSSGATSRRSAVRNDRPCRSTRSTICFRTASVRCQVGAALLEDTRVQPVRAPRKPSRTMTRLCCHECGLALVARHRCPERKTGTWRSRPHPKDCAQVDEAMRWEIALPTEAGGGP